MEKKIAVLVTSYNRVEKTIKCIECIVNCHLPENITLDYFIVDDGSTDNTGALIKNKYPFVNVIYGTGNLYWCGGMRLAWDIAYANYDYDFYLWVNDDTMILDFSLLELICCHDQYLNDNNKNAIVFGFCSSFISDKITYGGYNEKVKLIPNGYSQKANLINGNLVLVPREVFRAVGNLSSNYTHGMADYDYSLRAAEKSIDSISSRKIIANCERNIDIMKSNNYSIAYKFNIILRIIRDKDIKFKFSEYIYFRKRFYRERIIFIYLKYILFHSLRAFSCLKYR